MHQRLIFVYTILLDYISLIEVEVEQNDAFAKSRNNYSNHCQGDDDIFKATVHLKDKCKLYSSEKAI